MIVRTLDELDDTDRDVVTAHWRSRRIVLARDGAGFSLHETVLEAGSVNDFWYAHHVEAVLVIEGDGELFDKETGATHRLGPGSMYLLDGHEHHQLRPRTRMRMVCVFTPALTGREVHDEHGAYPLRIADDPADEPRTEPSR